MADYDTLETSVEGSRPIEVYRITLGSSEYLYTTSEDDLTIDGDDYEAIPISRNNIVVGSDQQRRAIQITVPATNDFARQYLSSLPGEVASVSIFRYQRDESPAFDTTVLLFTGTVQSVQFSEDGTRAQINVRSLEGALSRNVPRFTFLGQCNHFLFDRSCGVDPSAFNHVGVVTVVSGYDITISGLAASGFDFVGGYARPVSENDFRLVLSQSTDTLTLILPFQNDQAGNNVQVFAGCDHVLTGDCALTFDNVANFGGFAFVPTWNVFQSGIKLG
ncbi:MAG TPA: DUF2163 domain-containing protein [Polyangiales bacterium]|nr:DUF2163 domain-containing protein [Polyangiales bacterium]